jgi:hypothetical protein
MILLRIKRFFSLNHQKEPIQFFYKRNDGNRSISGILDVDSLEGFADSIEDFLEKSPDKKVIIHNIRRGSNL